MNKIAVIGAGTMGSNIALVTAKAGYEVILKDVKEEYIKNAFNKINKHLNKEIKKDRLSENERKAIINNITGVINMDPLLEADLIIEAINEDIKLKKEVFKKLDDLCEKNTILATNTSSLSISEIANVTSRPDKIIGVHFFNPATVMKLVEVIKGVKTSNNTLNSVKKYINKIGKTEVEVKEAPGFVVNRLLVPMINEAIFILAEGTASAEDIDTAMKLGANHPMGPLALGDLIGLDICLAVMESIYRETGDPKYRPCPLLRKMVRAKKLGRKTGEGFYSY